MRRKQKSLVIWAIVSILFFFLAQRLSFISTKLINETSSYLVYPVLVMQRLIVDPIKSWREQRMTVNELKATIEQLHQERESLLAELIKLEATRVYAEQTKEVRDFIARYDEQANIHTAQILARHFSETAHFYLVDAGSNQGIEPDMVAVYNNVLIGRVVEVYPWYSKVRLITDAACKVSAYCAHTKASGIHEGKNNDTETQLCYVSHLDSVHENDLVISSGEGLIFPAGFALGRIAAVKRDNLYHHVTIKPLMDLRAIHYCVLMAKGQRHQ